MIEWDITKNFGHPWDQRPGWDLLEVVTNTQAEMDAFIKKAADKFWQPWIIGTPSDSSSPWQFSTALYKPSGIMEAWIDPGPNATLLSEQNHAKERVPILCTPNNHSP